MAVPLLRAGEVRPPHFALVRRAVPLDERQMELVKTAVVLVVYDLEYTTWPGAMGRKWRGEGEEMEVVQVGAVKLRAAPATDGTRMLEEVDALSLLVKPAANPELSEYFTKLTGVRQEKVDADGVAFPTAWERLMAFAGDAPLISWGSVVDLDAAPAGSAAARAPAVNSSPSAPDSAFLRETASSTTGAVHFVDSPMDVEPELAPSLGRVTTGDAYVLDRNARLHGIAVGGLHARSLDARGLLVSAGMDPAEVGSVNSGRAYELVGASAYADIVAHFGGEDALAVGQHDAVFDCRSIASVMRSAAGLRAWDPRR